MKSKRGKRTIRDSAQGPAFSSEPAVVPTRPVVFDELRRRGWVHVMGEGSELKQPRGRRRAKASPR